MLSCQLRDGAALPVYFMRDGIGASVGEDKPPFRHVVYEDVNDLTL
jgi:hypothetical protein